MTYPVDFRRHVLGVRAREGLTYEETSQRFGVGKASLTRWSNELEPKGTREGRPRKIDLEQLRADVAAQPDAYIHERAQRFGVHPKSMWDALRKIKVSYKKNAAPSQGGRKRSADLPRKDQGA